MVVTDADVHAFFLSLLRYRAYNQFQFNACVSGAKAGSLPVLASMKLTPSHDFISQFAQSSSLSTIDDLSHASAAYLLQLTSDVAPNKDVSPFAAFLTEHYFVSILTIQVVGASLRLQHGTTVSQPSRRGFVCSDLVISSLRCLAFLASNVKLQHIFLRPDPATAPSSSVAKSLRAFDVDKGLSVDLFAADSPQARLKCLDRAILAENLSPADIMNILCDEQTPYVMTTTDIVSTTHSGVDCITRCAFGRMMLMEPLLSNAISFILHNFSSLQQLPRFAMVSTSTILGTRVELGRCSGVMSASFSWDGPSVIDGGVRHHPSLFPFASLNSIDCALICLSLLISGAEAGHGWFALSAGGGSQFFSLRGSMIAFGNIFSRSANFLRKIQQPDGSPFSDALYLSFQQSLLRGRTFISEPAKQYDRPHTPQTPLSKRYHSSDTLPVSPLFTTNLQIESAALAMSQYSIPQYLMQILASSNAFTGTYCSFIT